jgi:hypothetical protein
LQFFLLCACLNCLILGIIDGTSNAAGNTAVTFREVSCGFGGNILYQWNALTSNHNLIINFAHHNTQLLHFITVTETGLPSYDVIRGAQSNGNFAWSARGYEWTGKLAIDHLDILSEG